MKKLLKVKPTKKFGFFPVQKKIHFTTNNTPNEKDLQNHVSWRDSFLKLEKKLEKMDVKYKGYSVLKILGIGFGIAIVLSYIFWDRIKGKVGQEGVDLANNVLTDEKVKTGAEELSKTVLTRVLTDQQTMEQLTVLLNKISADEQTLNMVVQLLLDTIKDPKTKESTQEFLKISLLYLFQDPLIQEKTSEFVKTILLYPSTQETLNWLIVNSLKSKDVQDEAANFIGRLSKDPWVNSQLTELLKQASINVFNDKTVHDHAKKFVQDVISDNSVHDNASDAIWSTLKKTVTPPFWR